MRPQATHAEGGLQYLCGAAVAAFHEELLGLLVGVPGFLLLLLLQLILLLPLHTRLIGRSELCIFNRIGCGPSYGASGSPRCGYQH